MKKLALFLVLSFFLVSFLHAMATAKRVNSQADSSGSTVTAVFAAVSEHVKPASVISNS